MSKFEFIFFMMLIVGATIVSSIAIFRVTENTKLLIEKGYVMQQKVGSYGSFWVKK